MKPVGSGSTSACLNKLVGRCDAADLVSFLHLLCWHGAGKGEVELLVDVVAVTLSWRLVWSSPSNDHGVEKLYSCDAPWWRTQRTSGSAGVYLHKLKVVGLLSFRMAIARLLLLACRVGEGELSCSVESYRFGGGWGGSVGQLAASTRDHQWRLRGIVVIFDIWSHSKPKHRRCSWFFFLPRWRIFGTSTLAYYGAPSSSGFVPDVGVIRLRRIYNILCSMLDYISVPHVFIMFYIMLA